MEIYRKRIAALILMSATPFLAAGPFLIGLLGASLTPGCNESNCGWGVLPWFSFLTAPVALVLFILAFIRFLNSLRLRLNKDEEKTPENRKLKSFYFAWLGTASGPFILAVLLLLAMFGGPVSICDTNDICTETGTGAFVRVALIIAPGLIGLSWLYIAALWIWHKRKTKD
jgi:MFS family permease